MITTAISLNRTTDEESLDLFKALAVVRDARQATRGHIDELKRVRAQLFSGAKIDAVILSGWQLGVADFKISVPIELVKPELDRRIRELVDEYRKILIAARDAIVTELDELRRDLHP